MNHYADDSDGDLSDDEDEGDEVDIHALVRSGTKVCPMSSCVYMCPNPNPRP